MRRIILLLSSIAIFTSIIGLWLGWRSRSHSPSLPYTTTTLEKPFVIIVPSYNNSRFVERNLQSIFAQRYTNYRIIYIDDHSTDQTYDLAKALIAQLGQAKRTTLIRNSTNVGALANLYRAIHSCLGEEIVLLVDGDDCLAHEEVLSTLNAVYTDPSVWMTYGNYLDYPSFTQDPIICKPIPRNVIKRNTFRKKEWMSSHLRTFYASLFQAIKLIDLFYKGRCFPIGGDLALMFPMLEMAGTHARYLPDILYLYNRTNPLNDHKINFAFQQECAQTIRSRKPYQRLDSLPTTFTSLEEKADLLIFSYNRPLQLYALLESIENHMKGINQLFILYRADPSFQAAYEIVKSRFPNVTWSLQIYPPEDFEALCKRTIFSSGDSPYILFAVDDMIVKEPINLAECIYALEKTKAHGFYLGHSLILDTCYMSKCYQGIPLSLSLQFNCKDPFFAWQFSAGSHDWAYPNSVDMVLYRKKDIKKDFKKISFHNPFSLEHHWALRAKKEQIGLFYPSSKSLNLPLNLVIPSSNAYSKSYSAQELLEKFESGMKMDISKIFSLKNHSRHIDVEVSFLPRDDVK